MDRSPAPAKSVAQPKPDASKSEAGKPEVLDQKKIHGDYNDGNFELVINSLEAYMHRNKSYSRGDSVFIAKHLAVVYSANPATREKGKYYMNRLLELLPSAKLVDMYVSDEIDRIFDKVREEFLSRQKSFGIDGSMVNVPDKAPRNGSDTGSTGNTPASGGAIAAGASGKDGKAGNTGKPKAKSEGGNTGYWIAAGTGVVAAGILTYYFVSVNSNKASDKTYVVP